MSEFVRRLGTVVATLDRVVWVAAATLIALAVMAAGAAYDTGRAAIEFGAAFLAGLWSLRALVAPDTAMAGRLPWRWAAAICLLIALPLVSLPPAVIGGLSPRTFELYSAALPAWPQADGLATLAGGIAADRTWRPLSLVRWNTLTSIGLGAAYALLFGVAAAYPWATARALRLAGFIVAVAFAEALYSFLQSSQQPRRILWFACLDGTTCTGTYLNRNHFAGLLEMALPLSVASAAGRAAAARRRLARRDGPAPLPRLLLGGLTDPDFGRLLLSLGVAMVLVVAMAVSGSRAAFLVSGAVLLITAPLMPRGQRGRRRWLAGAVALGALLWLTFPQLRDRLTLSDPTRAALAADAWSMARDFPLLGVGLGNFSTVYPLYRRSTVEMWGFDIEHAHNDWLELLAEVGSVAALLLSALLAILARRATAVLRAGTCRHAWMLWGCAAGSLAMLLHSLSDFNLHTPANALVFACLLGLLYRLAREPDASTPARRPERVRIWSTLALGAALLWAGVAWQRWAALAQFRGARPDLPLWDMVSGRGGERDALVLLRRAAAELPTMPEVQAELGRALLARRSSATDAETTRVLLASLGHSPLQPHTLINLAEALDAGAPATSVPAAPLELVGRAIRLAPYDPEARLRAADWLLARWDRLTELPPGAAAAQVREALALAARAPQLRDWRTRTAAAYARVNAGLTSRRPASRGRTSEGAAEEEA